MTALHSIRILQAVDTVHAGFICLLLLLLAFSRRIVVTIQGTTFCLEKNENDWGRL